MATLTDFLLARIAEDERTALAAFEQANQSGDDPTGSTLYVNQADSSGDWIVAATPMRARDDAEAKRRLIDQVLNVDWVGYAARDFVLSTLAEPYADHDDYQPAWRR